MLTEGWLCQSGSVRRRCADEPGAAAVSTFVVALLSDGLMAASLTGPFDPARCPYGERKATSGSTLLARRAGW